jgi:hypothetical protein
MPLVQYLHNVLSTAFKTFSFVAVGGLYVLGLETPVTTEFFPSSRLAPESNSVVALTILEQGVLKLQHSPEGLFPHPNLLSRRFVVLLRMWQPLGNKPTLEVESGNLQSLRTCFKLLLLLQFIKYLKTIKTHDQYN